MENIIKSRHTRSSVIFGLLLLIVGFCLILTNMGFLPRAVRGIFFSWQMLLIVIGVASFFNKNYSFGFIMLGVGAFFILPKLSRLFPDFFGFIPANFTSNFWPLLLIVAGLSVIIASFYKPQRRQYNTYQNGKEGRKRSYSSTGEGYFEKSVVFGDSEHIILEPQFLGAKATVVFGNMILDLRKSFIPEGETTLQSEVVFGNLTVVLPPDCKVKPMISTVLGGFEDNRRNPEPIDTNQILVLSGESIFGNIEISD